MADRIELVIVQHAEKKRTPGDPGLTNAGREQAAELARHLALTPWDALYSSPLVRARETAAAIGTACGLEMLIDGRLRERMSWEAGSHAQTYDEFVADWDRSTADRSWKPPSGESSITVGARFMEAISDFAAMARGPHLLVVSHGGATTDLLRSLIGDDALLALAPGVIADGIPTCAITRLAFDGTWRAVEVAATGHLD